MKTQKSGAEKAGTLLIALSTIIVLSLVAAGVLMNCTNRYNASATQVRGWKEALQAAESGGDIAFASVRQLAGTDDWSVAFPSASGWTSPAPSPLPSTFSTSLGFDSSSPLVVGEKGNMRAKVTVDRFDVLPGSNPPVGYYRIRSIGTAEVSGLKRTGMDNRLDSNTKGDNFLRKIDFGFDHFLAAYGYGDALPSASPTARNGKALVAVANPQKAEVTRRIELVAVPIMSIEGAVKTVGGFHGTLVDSFDSQYGAYAGSNPGTSPFAENAHDGDVICGSSSFSVGQVYGDVTTNGGNAPQNKVSGVVDNSVPITVPPSTPGTAPIPNLPGPSPEATAPPANLTPPTRFYGSASPLYGQQQTTFWYTYSSLNGLSVNPLRTTVAAGGVPANSIIDTTVNIYVTGDIRGLDVQKGVSVNVYFRGNMGDKARDYDNNNIDGPDASATKAYVQQWVWDSTTSKYVLDATTPYVPSPLVSRSGHMWFYGIAPTDGSARSINIGPPGEMHAGFYAPGHDFSVNGNPDIYGVMVCKSFTMNGNCTFHFDKQLALNVALDYRISSYIEDTR